MLVHTWHTAQAQIFHIMTKINVTMKKYGNVIIAVGVPPRLEGRESEVIITGVETPFIFFLLCFDIQ